MANFYTEETCEAGVLQMNETEIRIVAGGEFGDVVMTVAKDDAQAVATLMALWADMVAED